MLSFLKRTSFCNAEAELQDDPTEVAAETGLVGAIDGDDGGLAGTFTELDHDGVVAGDAHVCYARHRGGITKLPPAMLGLESAWPPDPKRLHAPRRERSVLGCKWTVILIKMLRQ